MTAETYPLRNEANRAPGRHAAGGSLQVSSLVKRFGDVAAVSGVDLSVLAGEFVSLLGPSGSGKTTTLSIIAGLEHPDSGRVILDGADITMLPAHKRNLGVVFQSYALFPHMTVAENLAYPLRCRKTARKDISRRVRWALELVQLPGYDKRYPRELSGGQQQRVAFARAVIYSPRVLLMDEPLSALDRRLRDELQAEIRALHRDLGTTVIYVTHDQGEALSLSDRVVVMSGGTVEQVGTPEEVYERPASEFVARFVGTPNFLRGAVVNAPDASGLTRIRLSNGSTVSGKCRTPVATGADVQLLIRPEKLHVGAPDVAAQGSSVKVRVTDDVYQGHFVLCRGTFETGEPCRLHVSREEAARLLRDGEDAVWWRPSDGIVLAPEERPLSGGA